MNRDLARLTAVTLTAALFIDFLFLPPLLIWVEKMRKDSLFKNVKLLLAVGCLLLLPIMLSIKPVFASNEKGLEIAEETSKRDDGFINFTVEGQMILKNKAGKESLRKFKTTTLENPDPREGDKGIIVFLEPRDVKGTSLLTALKNRT